jgi:3-dehydroquinate synthase
MQENIEFIENHNGFTTLHNFLKNPQISKVFVLTDENTFVNCYPLLRNFLPAGKTVLIRSGLNEEKKNLDSVRKIWDELFHHNADRKSVLINLGGGVVTDTGGFAASTFKRGIDYINIPTTLLAMVDAALGGKTGINYAGAKNQIGTIRLPRKILIWKEFLRTLPQVEFMSGLAEMIKHGLIRDEKYFYQTVNYQNYSLENLIRKSVDIKTEIVREDLHESGVRQLLNFGHSIGHAAESLLYETRKPVKHGHAVAFGMLVEACISTRLTGLSGENYKIIKNNLTFLYNMNVFADISIDNLITKMAADKKNISGRINMVLLKKIGKAEIIKNIPEELIRECLKQVTASF